LAFCTNRTARGASRTAGASRNVSSALVVATARMAAEVLFLLSENAGYRCSWKPVARAATGIKRTALLAVASHAATVLDPPPYAAAIEGPTMANEEQNEQHMFHAVSGFRTSVPPDRPELLLLELRTLDADIIRLSMTKESALMFSEEVRKAAAGSAGLGLHS
jgi:hypothetical protein